MMLELKCRISGFKQLLGKHFIITLKYVQDFDLKGGKQHSLLFNRAKVNPRLSGTLTDRWLVSLFSPFLASPWTASGLRY
jgi:hypothetical protein